MAGRADDHWASIPAVLVGVARSHPDELGIDADTLGPVSIEGTDEVVLAFEVDPVTWFDTWQVLRNGVEALGAWPLAVWPAGGPLGMISRFEAQGPDGLDGPPSAIISRVPDTDVDRLLDAERPRQREQWAKWRATPARRGPGVGATPPR